MRPVKQHQSYQLTLDTIRERHPEVNMKKQSLTGFLDPDERELDPVQTECPRQGPLKPYLTPFMSDMLTPLEHHSSPLGKLTTTVRPISRDTVTMTTSPLPLWSDASSEAQTGRRERRRRRSKFTHLHTRSMDISLWCWCKETSAAKNLPSSSWDEALWSWSGMRGKAACTPPTQSHDAINHDHNQGQRLHAASTILIYS